MWEYEVTNVEEMGVIETLNDNLLSSDNWFIGI